MEARAAITILNCIVIMYTVVEERKESRKGELKIFKGYWIPFISKNRKRRS